MWFGPRFWPTLLGSRSVGTNCQGKFLFYTNMLTLRAVLFVVNIQVTQAWQCWRSHQVCCSGSHHTQETSISTELSQSWTPLAQLDIWCPWWPQTASTTCPQPYWPTTCRAHWNQQWLKTAGVSRWEYTLFFKNIYTESYKTQILCIC